MGHAHFVIAFATDFYQSSHGYSSDLMKIVDIANNLLIKLDIKEESHTQ